MRKKWLIILLTVALFIGGTVLGATATFRVDAVTIYSSEISQPAKAEAEELLQRLEDVYVDKSIFGIKQSDADDVMAEFPYFRITAFRRSYPNRVIISIAEGEETYAVEGANEQGEYFILNGEGTVLGIRADSDNRLDGERNVLLKGYTCEGVKGEALTGDVALVPTLTVCGEISTALNGIRGNVRHVEVVARTNTEHGIVLMLQMQEGVKLYVYAAENATQEKAALAVQAYLDLSVSDRMSGSLMVYDSLDGEVTSAYRPEGGLPL